MGEKPANSEKHSDTADLIKAFLVMFLAPIVAAVLASFLTGHMPVFHLKGDW